MAKYIFKKDFPPTDWKKGDEFDTGDYFIRWTKSDLAILLHLGIIEEAKENVTFGVSTFIGNDVQVVTKKRYATEAQAIEAREKIKKLLNPLT